MSRLTVYAVNQAGECVPHTEFRNSWGGAILIWDYLIQKYFPLKPGQQSWEGEASLMIKMQPVWDLFKRSDVDLIDRIALGSTFDMVMVKRENIKALAIAFTALHQRMTEMGLLTNPDRVNHILLQADLFREMAGDSDIQAICWQQTSCARDMWRVKNDKEDEESHPYNINTDTGHWFLFDEIMGKGVK